MGKDCPRCGGSYISEDGDFGDKILKCIMCGRSPDEKQMTLDEVLMIMKGKVTRSGRRRKGT